MMGSLMNETLTTTKTTLNEYIYILSNIESAGRAQSYRVKRDKLTVSPFENEAFIPRWHKKDMKKSVI